MSKRVGPTASPAGRALWHYTPQAAQSALALSKARLLQAPHAQEVFKTLLKKRDLTRVMVGYPNRPIRRKTNGISCMILRHNDPFIHASPTLRLKSLCYRQER